MAAPGKGLAILLEVDGYDPYRVYCEEPQAGGWRELRNPVGGQRYWNHVALRLTTWSLVELLRLNGLEEFLLLGEWGVFVVVPEDVKTYEDVEWGLPIHRDDQLRGKPLDRIKRGSVVVSLGFARPGILELLLPDEEKVVRSVYAPMRAAGKRLVQRLPVRMHNDDIAGTMAITVPMFRIRPADDGKASSNSALVVTADRDPRSDVLGYVKARTVVGLATVVGTRAQLARIPDGPRHLWGGWISFLLLDGTPTLERVCEDTENMRRADQLKQHLAEIEAIRAAAIANGEDPDEAELPAPPSGLEQEEEEESVQERPKGTAHPPVRAKVPPEFGVEQRMTVSGGWRQVVDKVWYRPVYIQPLAGRMTWGFNEVIASGGLDDLLLARNWEICVVDPVAQEDQKDKTYCSKVFSDVSMSGQPIALLPKGRLVVVQVFHKLSQTAMLVLPPSSPGGSAAVGFAFYLKRDGRSILRAMLPQAPVDDGDGRAPDSIPPSALGYPDEPEGPILEGPYFAEPPEGQSELTVSIGQDLDSDRWARLPRGYCVRTFAEILGFRARLPDLEGGGWVSLMGADGTPFFRKQPLIPPVLELPGQESVMDEEDNKLPIVWPGLGVVRPAIPVPVKPHVQSTLPNLLYQLGGGRALCDWHRGTLPPSDEYIWRNPLTSSQAVLDGLLRYEIWRIAVVDKEDLPLRERPDPRSQQVTTLPRGALVIAEWVAPGNAIRLLLPSKPDDPNPAHVWADIGGHAGALLRPLAPGGDFWVEPRGGHLPEELQCDPDEKNVARLPVRAALEMESAPAGYLQRGDGVQMAELVGRRVRLVHTKCVVPFDTAPNGGWVDLFDEAGWSVLRIRFPGDVHPADLIAKERAKAEEEEEERRRRPMSATPSTDLPAQGAEGAAHEDISITDMSSEAASELPALLSQLGELEGKSVWTRDWREQVDPVWGQRYFVNKWSGQIVHRLSSIGVACPAVRLTVWFSNLSLEGIRADCEEDGPGEVERRIKNVERALLPSMAALADVDDDRMELSILEGAEEAGDATRGTEDSILGGSGMAGAEAEGFRVVAVIRAPGARSSWASGALKQAMADGEHFTSQMVMLMSSLPDFMNMRVDPYGDVALLKADLEELDIPRVANMFAPPPPPAPPPPLPVAEEFEEIRRSYMWTKQKLLHFHCKQLGLGDSQALSDGLQASLPEPALEELGMWGCKIGDGGTFALSKALDVGCGANLHTLLLDENEISAAGATALGAGLAKCAKLRELGVSRNPIGKGFAKLLAGVGKALVVLDASEADIDDAGAAAAAAALRRLPALRSLRLFGNAGIGPLGVEAIARGLLGAPSVKLADLKGADDGGEWPRLKRVLQDGGVLPEKMRV